MEKEKLDLIKVVAENLLFLKNEWDESIKDASLRINSSVLRLLIVENKYTLAWQAIGFEREPKVKASILNDDAIFDNSSEVSFAQAGGATFGGIQIEGLQIINKALSPEEINAYSQKKLQNDKVKEALGMKKFADSISFIIEGTPINRRELIKYITNKKGGTHIDSKRKENDKEDTKFALLDSLSMITANKNSIYYELLSIGQCIANSKDADKFIKKAKSLVQLDY